MSQKRWKIYEKNIEHEASFITPAMFAKIFLSVQKCPEDYVQNNDQHLNDIIYKTY